MKTIAVFGGTGGLGKKLVPLLQLKYNVLSIGSKKVDIINQYEVENFFVNNDIDIVLNMAGKMHSQFLSNFSYEDGYATQAMIDVNIVGGINILRYCLPQMIKRTWGRIIFMSSVFAELNIPKNAIYCASKAFVDRLIGVANRENAKYGITCNSIQLGYGDGGMGGHVNEEYQEMAKAKVPLKRFVTIEELYATIQFLINTEYACGINLKVAGGL